LVVRVGVVVVGGHGLFCEVALHAVPPRISSVEELLLVTVEPCSQKGYALTAGG
jgi:hypothetical protein